MAVFLCNEFLITSQVTTTTPTPHVTSLCSGALTITTTVTMAPTSVGLTTTLASMIWFCCHHWSQGTHEGCCWSLCSATTASSVPDAFSGIYQLCCGSPLGKSTFLELESSTEFLCWYLLWYLLFDFEFQYECHFHQWGFNHWVCTTTTPQSIPKAYEAPVDDSCPMRETHWGAAPSTASNRGPLAIQAAIL